MNVTDFGGSPLFGYWFVIRDRRLDLRYAIEGHCDYWDLISYSAAGSSGPVPLPTNQSSSRFADDGSGGA